MEGDDEPSGPMIDDEIYNNGVGGDEEKPTRPIISGEQLDVEAYAGLYTGRTKITRLLFIASHCDNNQTMQLEALRMAYDEIKKGENTQLFREVVQKIDGRLGPNYGMDVAWCEMVDRRAEQKKEKLENELNAYRVHLCYSLLLLLFFKSLTFLVCSFNDELSSGFCCFGFLGAFFSYCFAGCLIFATYAHTTVWSTILLRYTCSMAWCALLFVVMIIS